MEDNLLHLFIRYLCAPGIVLLVQPGADAESGCGSRRANELQDGFVVYEGLGGPVLTDEAEHAVFDGVPLGGAGRVVADFDVQTEAVAESDLELVLPQACAVTVASSTVSQDKQAVGIRVALGAELRPPGADRIHGELRRVTGGADADQAVIT